MTEPSDHHGTTRILNCVPARYRCWMWLIVGCVVTIFAKPVTAADRWPDERVVGPFHWHADASLANYDSLIAEMGHLQDDLVQLLRVEPSREPVHVFVFQQKATYQDYMRQYYPRVPYRRALFIKDRGPGMVYAYRSPELEVDLRHESTHALLHGSLPMVPLWLDEGLAEYFEVPASQRSYDNPHLSSTKWTVRFGQASRIEDLEELAELTQMGKSEYRHAWSWVHFMLHSSPEAHDVLIRYLADINAQVPPGKLSERLRRRLPDLDQRFADHFKNWRR